MNTDELLEIAMVSARRAGLILSELYRQNCKNLSEDKNEIKLQADKESEEAILDVLTATPYPVLSEETGWTKEYVINKPYWVVDPLDGSFNFSRKIPFSAVSIALMKNEETVLGVVYDFLRDEMFSASEDTGARLNNNPIHVSSTQKASEAVIATGFPIVRPYNDNEFYEYLNELKRFNRVRLLGPSALSLAYVACGRVDAFIQDEVKIWDISAGTALVQFAGGVLTIEHIEGVPFTKKIRSACRKEIWIS
ncbi:MAG: inositol monophosphatase [Candidatus Hydrogenedens sp.]|nr:inositol monophosphatase [Candidatus Hydrogenedens sp.]